MSITLRVTPEKLKSQAAAVETVITEIANEYKNVETLALKFPSYWEGDAFEYNRQALSGFMEKAEAVLKELKDKPARLLTMADLYEAAEQQNQEAAQQLDKDIIT